MGVGGTADCSAKRGGNKRTVDVREVVNGLMYVLRTGCQWRAIPKDLPPRSTVHDYFDLWAWDGTLDRIEPQQQAPSDGISSASACNCSGNDLHHQANYPSRHYCYCPKDVRALTKHNHADRYKSRQGRDKRADGTEELRRINLSTGTASRRSAIRFFKR
jgi:hypothetical protein